jgi:hypothetical protein
MNCPFCGVSADVAHETQEACIEALNVEIRRMRELLKNVRAIDVPGRSNVDEHDGDETPSRGPREV